MHKGLKRTRFDVEKYNKLRGDIAEVPRGRLLTVWTGASARHTRGPEPVDE